MDEEETDEESEEPEPDSTVIYNNTDDYTSGFSDRLIRYNS